MLVRMLLTLELNPDAKWKEKHLTAKEVGFEIKSKVPDEIHGAPLIGFVTHLAEIMSSIKTGRQMAEFWSELIKELRCLWRDGVPIPHVPVDNVPDLRYCLLHQQLQVVNCCIARRKKRSAALFSLDKLQETATTFPIQGTGRTDRSVGLYAICKDANPVLRLGADHPSGNLKMLETQEPVYSPITQEGPVLTEDLIKETEELVLRTKSVGAGCSQLFSDMQAFKAANPGCILEDFVRLYSPPDWKEGSVLAVDGAAINNKNKTIPPSFKDLDIASNMMQPDGANGSKQRFNSWVRFCMESASWYISRLQGRPCITGAMEAISGNGGDFSCHKARRYCECIVNALLLVCVLCGLLCLSWMFQ